MPHPRRRVAMPSKRELRVQAILDPIYGSIFNFILLHLGRAGRGEDTVRISSQNVVLRFGSHSLLMLRSVDPIDE